MLELIYGTKTKTRILEELSASGAAKTRNELVKQTGCGIKGVYEQTDELITLRVLKETKNKPRKFELNPQHPLYQDIKNISLQAIDYKKNIIKNILSIVDSILGDDYYLGFYTAARKKITPIDYDPQIYTLKILNKEYEKAKKKLMVFNRVREIGVQKEGSIQIIPLKCNSIPKDVIREEILNNKVWICSTERGIIECFTKENKYYSRYGTCLALLQNKIEDTLNEKLLIEIAEDEEVKDRLIEVMGCFNYLLKKRLFNAEPEKAPIREVRQAINTVIG
ncbi:MAG: hypothetical protein U9M95_05590 [Candidatus Altiarchaeota archaeon]|nr:hypothetical protein [Candidatus Altiarchaeota archaeon]